MNQDPLVSIVIITYNSSKYALDTLESAKAQTYDNIELIISDDCSMDNTVEICTNWLKKNKKRFVNTVLVTTEKNSGIPANCNRGIMASSGQWIKYIAGDDVLNKNCIERFIYYIKKNNSINVVFSRIQFLKGDAVVNDERKEIENARTVTDQRKILLKGSGIKAPGSFIKKSVLEDVGLFAEKYRFIEDLPMWIKLNEHNVLFGFIPEFLVKYRIHDESVFSSKKHFFTINKNFHITFRVFCSDVLFSKLLIERHYLQLLKVKYNLLIDSLILKVQDHYKLIALCFWFLKSSSLHSVYKKMLYRFIFKRL